MHTPYAYSLKEVEAELLKRQHDDPLKEVYKPHEFQTKVHKSRARITVVLGGNRSGKSWSAVAEALLIALGRSVYAETPRTPVTIWYVLPSLGMFTRVVLPILRKLAPIKEIKLTPMGDIVTKKDPVVRFKNGSTIHFMSADMRQRRLMGAPVDFAVMDESPEEAVFEELQARVMQYQHGRLLLVFSPIEAKTFWVRDKLYMPWLAGDRTDISFIFMPIADKSGNPLVPHFTKADIRRMEQQWPDPNVRAARMYGEFITRSGLVFRSFDHDIHMIEPFAVPKHYARWWVVDPEYHRFAALYFAADESGTYYVTDEYFSQDDTLAHRAERMHVITGSRDTAIPAYVDSANPQDTAELNWHFQRLNTPIGAVPLPIKKDVMDMVLRTHALLEPSDERQFPKITGDDSYGSPRILFFNTLMSTWKWAERDMQCSRLIWEIQRLSWGKGEKPDKDSAAGGDASDSLVYGCSIMQAGVYSPPKDEWMKRLSQKDILLWKMIDRADRMSDLSRLRE